MRPCTQTLGEGSEEDEEEMDMDIKEDDGKHISANILSDVDEGIALNSSDNQFQSHSSLLAPASASGGARRCRPLEEKERTKLRERHRRAITARILAGLRRHGNYNLRVRADINDVISALAREAGWIVLPDGTTFPSRTQDSRAVPGTSSLASVVKRPPPEFEEQIEKHENVLKEDLPPERDFSDTPNVPVYVMLPLRVINMNCEMGDNDGMFRQLRTLKSANIDGVAVEVWWGIVEANAPCEYKWGGYLRLFQMVRELQLKLKIALSFHECGGTMGEDFSIPLPQWVTQIGVSNPDIYFTDRDGRRNGDCLTWGVDKERVLRGRTALEVYFDFMRSFRVEFDEFFVDGTITMVEIGLGPCGEIRYPSFPIKHGWRYPGVGAFQCYDQYMMKGLRKAAESGGKSGWAKGPDNAGSCNSLPNETAFFCDGGEYDSHYGRFFLSWYSQVLLDHLHHMLSLANLVFDGSILSAKLSGVYWWYKTPSHAAELTAGFYNSSNRDGYAVIASILKRHGAVMNFVWNDDRPICHVEAFPDSKSLRWQILNAAWDVSLPVAGGNASPCQDRTAFNTILEYSKPSNDSGWRQLLSFTYHCVGPTLLEGHNFVEFQRFVKKMHGSL